MAGGVFTSGGSYACYPFNSSTGIGVCASCDSSPSCAGAGFNGYSGCSTCTKDCGEVHRNGPPCCSKCCPSNYTEEFFVDHPSEWARLPSNGEVKRVMRFKAQNGKGYFCGIPSGAEPGTKFRISADNCEPYDTSSDDESDNE